ncbi:hypothetical protein WJX72_002772 [[Myrmecia] bisecta]|uniref:F-box domain-containing protein n=1 Tax=[Myrmecia] bisecta TaxID=41462 RepID=A0AAW1PCG9_9CHLO
MEEPSLEGTEVALHDLPDECVVLILAHLEVKDVLCFEQTCKRWCQLARSPEVWQPRIRNSFHLRVKGSGEGRPSWQELFQYVSQTQPDTNIRFRGVFTDGGVDNSLSQYWVDNLFMPMHWESYCSATSTNIHCIGLLMAEEDTAKRDAREAALREYMIQRCQFPAALMWNEFHGSVPPLTQEAPLVEATVTRLRGWSTAELEALLAELFQELQNGSILGRRLVQGFKPKDVQVHLLKLHHIAASVPRSTTVEQARILPCTWQAGAEETLADSRVFEWAQATAEHHAGVIDKLVISRAGHFSCPVACGAIFVGNFAFELPPSPHPAGGCAETTEPDACFKQRVEALQCVVEEPVCRALDDVTSKAQLLAKVQQGLLPSIVARTETAAGVFWEFDPDWDPLSAPSSSGRDASSAHGSREGVARSLVSPHEASARTGGLPREDASTAGPSTERNNDAAAGPSTQAPGNEAGAGPRSQAGWAVAEIPSSARMTDSGSLTLLDDSGTDDSSTPDRMETSGSDDSSPDLIEISSDSANSDYSFSVEEDGSDQEGLADVGHFHGIDDDGRTFGRNRLSVELSAPCAGNLALVKLISPEDLMRAWGDQHDVANIDINHVTFTGRKVSLPPGFQLVV